MNAGSDQVKVIRISASGLSSPQTGSKNQIKGTIRIAGYDSMTAAEKRILRQGTGFVRVPDEERARQRIDAYPYLIP